MMDGPSPTIRRYDGVQCEKPFSLWASDCSMVCACVLFERTEDLERDDTGLSGPIGKHCVFPPTFP